MKTLTGKVALVTGGSRGIGAGTAVVLARYGADVAVNYVRAKDQADEVCERIRSIGCRAYPVQADVADGKAVTRMIESVHQNLGPIDVLVNNAGHNPNHSILEMSETDWDWVLDLNLKSYMLCTKAALPDMLEKKNGRIINITSISGQRGGLSCDVDYSSAKAGIMGFTRSLSRWAAPRGVLVNAIAPGYIETEHMRHAVSPERLAELVDSVPLKRLGTSEEVGEVVAFLAGPGGDYIVGEVITMNGGVHIA
jgi:3-oxoacyl-[acyl-carrier protein] reductase